MAEIEKGAVGFPVICHLVAGEYTSGGSTLFFSTAECFQLCYTNHNVIHLFNVHIVHVSVVHIVLVVNNLIRAHYIIMKTTVAFGGKLPPSLVGHQMFPLV